VGRWRWPLPLGRPRMCSWGGLPLARRIEAGGWGPAHSCALLSSRRLPGPCCCCFCRQHQRHCRARQPVLDRVAPARGHAAERAQVGEGPPASSAPPLRLHKEALLRDHSRNRCPLPLPAGRSTPRRPTSSTCPPTSPASSTPSRHALRQPAYHLLACLPAPPAPSLVRSALPCLPAGAAGCRPHSSDWHAHCFACPQGWSDGPWYHAPFQPRPIHATNMLLEIRRWLRKAGPWYDKRLVSARGRSAGGAGRKGSDACKQAAPGTRRQTLPTHPPTGTHL
jgi:hypothetical protein